MTYDTFGGLYEIPNYCIHEPMEYDLPEDHKSKPNEVQLRLIIRKGAELITLNVSNYTLVAKLKEETHMKFSNIKEREKIKRNKIMLFFGGKEMKDDKEIWIYNVIDEAIVLLMIKT